MNSLDLVARFEIYKQLPGIDLLKLCKLSKKFNEVCNNRSVKFNNLWLQKIQEDFNINLPYVENAVNYYRTYLKFLNKHNLEATNYRQIFEFAVRTRNFEIVEALLNYSPFVPYNETSENVVANIAVRNNDIEMVRLLLRDPRIANSDLLLAFSQSMQNRFKIAKLLVENSPTLMQNPRVVGLLPSIDRTIEAGKGHQGLLDIPNLKKN